MWCGPNPLGSKLPAVASAQWPWRRVIALPEQIALRSVGMAPVCADDFPPPGGGGDAAGFGEVGGQQVLERRVRLMGSDRLPALGIDSVAALAIDLQDSIAEIDIHPLIVLPAGQGVVAVDAFFKLASPASAG